MSEPQFRFPKDIKLAKPPLVEAWLELRWQVSLKAPNVLQDSDFAFALGAFYT